METQARLLSERLAKSEESESLLKAKASHRLTELKVRDYEDHLKHFQKLVQKDDELEKEYFKVRHLHDRMSWFSTCVETELLFMSRRSRRLSSPNAKKTWI